MADTTRYLIVKRDLYYRPNAQDYTGIKDEAGRYSLEEAISHTHPNGADGPCDGLSYVAEEDAPEYRNACYTDLMARHAGEKITRLTRERDAAQAEVARLTAALADAERRGAERMREAAADAVLYLCRMKGMGERTIDGPEAAHLIRALPLPEPPREEG